MAKSKSIPEELGVFNYKSYKEIPPAKLAWITIKAEQQGKDPKMVHAGIKAKMARKNYRPTNNIITKKRITTKKLIKKQQTIYEQLKLSEFKDYGSIPAAKLAWITIKAKKQGKDPAKVHAKIQREMGSNKAVKKKPVKTKSPKSLSHLYKGTIKTHLYSMNQGITRTPEFEKKGLAGFAINVGTKCDNDCLYCSSGSMLRMHRSFKAVGRDPYDFGYAIIDRDKHIKVAKNAAHMRKRGLIELCTTTDAWCPSAWKYNLGRKCLEAVLKEPDWTIRVLTKNHEVENDFDLIKKYRDRVVVGISITATPDKNKIMQVIEINASTIKDRMKVMRKAHKQGLRTYAMLCPLLPGIADSPEQIDSYVQFAESIGAEEIFSEAVNPRGRSIILTQQALEEAGYAKEAICLESIRNQKNWSEYTYQLIKNLQKSVRKYSSIKKLRFLLYSSNLTDKHVKAIRKDDAGIKWL